MNKITLTAACIIALASCNNTASPQKEAPAEHPKIELKIVDLATPNDLVCGMEVAENAIADTVVYEGKIYAFCATGCKDEFLKNPASYLATK